MNELDSSGETLVTLRIVVLETDLELYGFYELALLLAGSLGKELFDGTPHASH
jgi:hypothetical protein